MVRWSTRWPYESGVWSECNDGSESGSRECRQLESTALMRSGEHSIDRGNLVHSPPRGEMRNELDGRRSDFSTITKPGDAGRDAACRSHMWTNCGDQRMGGGEGERFRQDVGRQAGEGLYDHQ